MQIPLIQKSNGMYLFCSKDFDSVAECVRQVKMLAKGPQKG